MQESLKQALNVLMDVQDASGINRKKELLTNWKDNQTLQDILYFVFNPYIRTGIGWSKYKKFPDDNNEYVSCNTQIQVLFNYLKENNTGRDQDIIYAKHFIASICAGEINEQRFKDILASIVTKTLKLGVSKTTFDKIWPSLIPGFGIQLACKWQDWIGLLEKRKLIFITEKLDGNRCFAHVTNNEVTFYSRSGREIEGMSDIKSEMLLLNNGWYDGELLASNFNETQSIVRTKGKKEDLVFNIFDFVSEAEVEKQIGDVPYSLRRRSLQVQFMKFHDLKYIKLVPLLFEGAFDEEYVNNLLAEYTSKGSEGLMINLDSAYQFGRTCELLKVKKMQTMDLEVIHITEGSGEFAGMVGALVVDYKGFAVGVGSGIEKDQRIYWWEHPEEIIGRIIEVQYFEESSNDDGSLSLRFPVYTRTREIEKEVSYD